MGTYWLDFLQQAFDRAHGRGRSGSPAWRSLMCASVSEGNGDLPRWTNRGQHGHRVLLEEEDGAMAWAAERVLAAQGYDVVTCAGPQMLAAPCPLIEAGGCALAEGADTIVFALPLQDPSSQSVLTAHLKRRPARSLCVQVAGQQQKDKFRELLAGCQTVSRSTSSDGLVQSVRKAVG